MKIKKAMYLLETTSKPITAISEECGYFDYPYFYNSKSGRFSFGMA
jgi:YesN/AraC family two-component response regulator